MCFPPPARYYAPLLVLIFGLAATWFDYELNLANDLARNFDDVAAQAEATGHRLATLCEYRFANDETQRAAEDLAAWADEPWLTFATLVDPSGIVIADSENQLQGREASETLLAPAMVIARDPGADETQRADEARVFGAYPVAMGVRGTGWMLVGFDRADAAAQARTDARRQLRWVASAIALLCFCLWAALHFGFTLRLERLARAVRDFGEGRASRIDAIPGGDEVRNLSVAFSEMSVRLEERDAERLRLEREILESSERERRRIGTDLHDGVGQQLTAASLATNGLVVALTPTAPQLAAQAENLGRQLRETMAEVRALSHGLAPVALEDDALRYALKRLCEATALSSGLRCIFECEEPMRPVDAETAGHLFRIAQEAVTNALKHAAPAEIRVGFEQQSGVLMLEVEDDGDGISDDAPPTRGIGLRAMRHRAQLIGGALEIGSPPAGGTRIRCRVKLPA